MVVCTVAIMGMFYGSFSAEAVLFHQPLEHPSAFGGHGTSFLFPSQGHDSWRHRFSGKVTMTVRSSGLPSWACGQENYLHICGSRVKAVQRTTWDFVISPNLSWYHYLDDLFTILPLHDLIHKWHKIIHPQWPQLHCQLQSNCQQSPANVMQYAWHPGAGSVN